VIGDRVRSLLSRKSAAIMGILNVTPDSFSDGGRFNSPDSAIKRARVLREHGADIIDIGGESTRPGAEQLSEQQELDRVIPVIESLAGEISQAISIDTYKPVVMREAVAAGASMINDVNGLRFEGAVETVAELKVPVCIMHMLGQPDTMQASPHYEDVVSHVSDFFAQRINDCVSKGIERHDIVIDPGIGFGKTLDHNLQLLAHLAELHRQSNCQLLIGVSRKSLIDNLLNRPVNERMPASIALAVQAVLNGAKIVRVHDVRESYDAIRAIEAVLQQRRLK